MRIVLATLFTATLLAQTRPVRAVVPGTLSGNVRDENGNPVNSTVIISGNGIEQRTSAPTGTFQFTGLKPARYHLCAIPQNPSAGDPFVDSCLWEDASTPLLSVFSGQNRTGVALTIRRGFRLKVRVNDPANRLQREKAKPVDDILVQVKAATGPAQFVPVTASNPNAREHSIVVPFDTPHSVSIHSPTFVLKDQSARDVDPKSPVTQNVSRGQPQDIVVTIDREK